MEYLVDLNATQAAIRAGYSRRTARAAGCENLTKPDIKAAISGEIEARKERLSIKADRVVQELALIGFSGMADVIEVDGSGAIKIMPFDSPTSKTSTYLIYLLS